MTSPALLTAGHVWLKMNPTSRGRYLNNRDLRVFNYSCCSQSSHPQLQIKIEHAKCLFHAPNLLGSPHPTRHTLCQTSINGQLFLHFFEMSIFKRNRNLSTLGPMAFMLPAGPTNNFFYISCNKLIRKIKKEYR